MAKQRYALWVHVVSAEMKTMQRQVIKFWGYDTDEEAERELLKLAEKEAAKDGVFMVEYSIRREDQDKPLTGGILSAKKEGKNA